MYPPTTTKATPRHTAHKILTELGRDTMHPGWVWYRSAHKELREMTRGIRAVARAIAEHAIGHQGCWPSRHALAKAAGVGRSTVHRAIRALIKAGLILNHHRHHRSSIFELVTQAIRPTRKLRRRSTGLKLTDQAGIAWAAGCPINPDNPPTFNPPETRSNPKMERRRPPEYLRALNNRGAPQERTPVVCTTDFVGRRKPTGHPDTRANAPDLREVRAHDLADPARVNDLYRQARAYRKYPPGERHRLLWHAWANQAADSGKAPARLAAWLWKHQPIDKITQDAEERARRAIKHLDHPTDRVRAQEPENGSERAKGPSKIEQAAWGIARRLGISIEKATQLVKQHTRG